MLVEPQFKYPESQQKRDRATGWKILPGFWKVHESNISIRDWSLFIAWGVGGGDLELNKVKFSRSPLWMLLHWSDLAP